MSKGIVNNRDKFVWDNAHKPTIDDAVAAVDDEMDGLLDDHDDKVVSIVGDNMGTLLTSNASNIQLIAGDLSGITSTPVKVGKWDATHDIYAKRFAGTFTESTSTIEVVIDATTHYDMIHACGLLKRSNGNSYAILSSLPSSISLISDYGSLKLLANSVFSNGSYDLIIYYTVSTATT